VRFKNLKLPPLIHKGNWKIILFSLIGASIFWFFNALNKDYTANIDQPLEFVFDEEGLVIVDLPEKVELNVSGGGWNLLRKSSLVNLKPVQIYLESPTTTKVMIGSTLRPLLSDQLDELEVNYVISDSLFINVEPNREKKVKLWIDSLGIDLRRNYRLNSPIRIAIDSILISGPESLVTSFSDTLSLIIDESRIDEDFSGTVEVTGLPRFVKSDIEEVDVSFGVSEWIPVTRKVRIDPLGFPQDSTIVFPSQTMEIRFMINENQSSNFPDSSFAVHAHFEEINPGDSTLLPRLVKYPSEIDQISYDSTAIRVIYYE
jgi:hypothetical protein